MYSRVDIYKDLSVTEVAAYLKQVIDLDDYHEHFDSFSCFIICFTNSSKCSILQRANQKYANLHLNKILASTYSITVNRCG